MSGPPRSSSNKAHLKAANSTFLFQFSFKKSFRAEPNLYISCLLNVSFFPHDKSLPHNFIPYEHMVSTQHKSVEFWNNTRSYQEFPVCYAQVPYKSYYISSSQQP